METDCYLSLIILYYGRPLSPSLSLSLLNIIITLIIHATNCPVTYLDSWIGTLDHYLIGRHFISSKTQ